MKETALVASLAVFASLASALADEAVGPETLKVQCSVEGAVTPEEPVKITVVNTTLTLTCPPKYTAEPTPKDGAADTKPTVYKSDDFRDAIALENYCHGATGKIVTKSSAIELHFPTVPSGLPGFYLKCAQPGSQTAKNMPCTVHVLVQGAAESGAHDSSSGGGSSQQGQTASPGGVPTCVQGKGPITVKVPEKESVAQFACGSDLTLYPTEQGKVFSKDCKTKETLTDMTCTQATGATSTRDGAKASTYTLKATKKPAKKTLCYVCATTEPTPDSPGTAEKSCIIYVESGAGTQFRLSFIVALALPCVLAVFQFT